MPNLARLTIRYPIYGWILILLCLVGGMHGVENVSRLEDPNFPMTWAYVITTYPGASAEEVEFEVTDRIEDSLQELPYVDKLVSKSVPGRSEILLEMREEVSESESPQIYDELRRRVSEAQMLLPPGAGTPLVEDDFSDIYGILYAIKARGYTEAEIHDMAKAISTKIKSIPNVAKIDTRGVPYEAVYIELNHARLTNFGLSIEDLGRRIWAENQVAPAGSALFDGRRLRVAQPTPLASVAELRDLRIGAAGSTDTIRLGDIAAVKRQAIEVPPELVTINGEPAFVIAVSVTPGENVVTVGHEVDALMAEIEQTLPLGVSVTPVYKQHTIVESAIDTFLRNLTISVATVVLALFLFMGWRAGIVVGLVLLLTVLGTIELMNVFGIELQRITLGALMMAMGMLVDNGIVIAEGMLVGVRRGQTPEDAAANSVARTQWALLGATIIGILAFAPISLSDDNSGHFLVTLFQVISISLLLSWIMAITVVPLIGSYLLKSTAAVPERELYSAWYFKPYEWMIGFGLRRAWITTLIIIGLTVAALYSMKFVKTAFFPTNNTPLFFVDYRLQEGTDILTVAADIEDLEDHFIATPGVTSVTSFIGRGAPRFAATVDSEQPNSSFASIMIQVDDLTKIAQHMVEADNYTKELRPGAEISVKRIEFSPTTDDKIAIRFSGPDPTVLRELAEQTKLIYNGHGLLSIRTNWRPQSLQLAPQYNEDNARLAGISRNDLSHALAYNTQGVNIGLMRDRDKLIPIIARAPATERADLGGLKNRQIWSPAQRRYIPMSQVVSQFRLEADNSVIYRLDRVRTITVSGTPPPNENVNQRFELLRGEVEAIPLQLGYSTEWGGEHEANDEANQALTYRIPPAFALMFFITILMFGALRQAIVIWLTVPMILCGVALALLVSNLPLTFPSMLGVLSLAGMLIKNCIVLVDEIDRRLAEGEKAIQTMEIASISRLRPVMLAALTTIFGMSPLLTDDFFREMAVCIMGGLSFATLITLVAVPVFYRIALGQRIAV